MARCLNPKIIRNPAPKKDGLTFLRLGHTYTAYGLAHRFARENIVQRSYEEMIVPCGKCLACLKNKQSSMVVRCKREAEYRGSFAFMTLTYDDDHLPLMRSLWAFDKDTGEQFVAERPEFISSGLHPDRKYCDLFKAIAASPDPRYYRYELPIPDPAFAYEVRITPSVCRSDVRTWLKMARIQYERDNGEKFPAFSYVAISEYGPRIRTCRPHYHLAFFGLQGKHLYYLLDRWKYGKVKQVRMVTQINKDGSNGFLRASKYIGKYMSKGKFECDSVSEGCSERPRVCQSQHLGSKALEPIRRYLLCTDMVGEYDPETLRRPDGSFLTRSQVDSLVDEIPRRLVYRVDEKTLLPMPRIIRDKIFKTATDEEDPKKKVSSTLWCMVTSAIRDKSVREGDDRFRQFCADHPEREVFENCLEFARFEAFSAGAEEATLFEDYRQFYSRSHF